jgi:hypothetical protein
MESSNGEVLRRLRLARRALSISGSLERNVCCECEMKAKEDAVFDVDDVEESDRLRLREFCTFVVAVFVPSIGVG